MKRTILALLFNWLIFNNAFCQIEKLVPINWKIVQKIEGDYNKDGFSDIFAVVDSMDMKNTWQCSKRMLMIFYGGKNGLFLADSNNLIFLDHNRLVDADVINLSAKDNKINIGIADFNFVGYNGGINYTFRLQNGKWFAIGCNMFGSRVVTVDGNREVEEEESFSYNFALGKHERITKQDSKTIFKKTKKELAKQYLFSQYNGDCNELMK